MTFNEIKDSIVGSVKNFKDFNGRADRKEFWIYTAVAFIVNMLLPVLNILVIIPYVGLSVRRMHDIGKRGYWAALNFVPAILSIGVWFLAVIAGLSCFWAQEELYGSELETFYLIICIVIGLVLAGYFLICLVCVGVFIWLCCKKSQPETNQWGPCPAVDVKADYVSSAESTETKSE